MTAFHFLFACLLFVGHLLTAFENSYTADVPFGRTMVGFRVVVLFLILFLFIFCICFVCFLVGNLTRRTSPPTKICDVGLYITNLPIRERWWPSATYYWNPPKWIFFYLPLVFVLLFASSSFFVCVCLLLFGFFVGVGFLLFLWGCLVVVVCLFVFVGLEGFFVLRCHLEHLKNESVKCDCRICYSPSFSLN